jgi:hypothetical protein
MIGVGSAIIGKWGMTASVTALVALFVAVPSHASITLGQLTPAGGPFGCTDGSYIVQTGIAGGPDYRVPPGGGVITGWKGRTFSTGGADQILQLAVIGDNVSGDAVTFEGLSDFEHLVPVAPSGRIYSFPTRISVDGGERIGLYAKDTSGPEAFNWGCAVPTGSGNADRDIWGALSAPVIGGPPAPATFGQFLSQRVPVEATLEADVDRDGFGDESQDQCPTVAATQGPCPITTAPETSISAHPKKKTTSRLGTFVFSSPTAGATFECRLDASAFLPCSSPHLVRVGKGKHTFAVRATANGQTDASPATVKWKVEKRKAKKRERR